CPSLSLGSLSSLRCVLTLLPLVYCVFHRLVHGQGNQLALCPCTDNILPIAIFCSVSAFLITRSPFVPFKIQIPKFMLECRAVTIPLNTLVKVRIPINRSYPA